MQVFNSTIEVIYQEMWMTVQMWKLETSLGWFGFIWGFLIIIFERGVLEFKQKISQKTERMTL